MGRRGAAKGVVGGEITLRKKKRLLEDGGRSLSEKGGDRADREEKLRAELRGAPAKDHLRTHRPGTRDEGDVPNRGGNSSPLKQLRLRPGGATRAAPPAPPPAHAPLPPSVPATAAYFHFRGHRGKDGKEREKRLAEALACAAGAESIEEAALEHPAPPLKVASAAAQILV